MMGAKVAVLFARSNSVYKRLPDFDVFDIERDARSFDYSTPVIAHPPCRAWGRLRTFAKPRHDEKALALFAVDAVRRCGGVLEHPASSSLWLAAGLPLGLGQDAFGGFTLSVDQFWWGHPCRKASWLYIVGCARSALPVMPFSLALPPKVIAFGRNRAAPGCELPKSQRENTPLDFALWLGSLARSCT